MDSTRAILRKLNESRLDESSVGAFYFIGDKILSNSVNVSQGEQYGDFVNYSSHWDLWRALCKIHPVLTHYNYDDFPRGRVVFNKLSRKFIVYIDKKLDNSTMIEKIRREYGLGSNYVIDTEDGHYRSGNKGDPLRLKEDVLLREPLSNYIKCDIN